MLEFIERKLCISIRSGLLPHAGVKMENSVILIGSTSTVE
jgi:hypothetical protein